MSVSLRIFIFLCMILMTTGAVSRAQNAEFTSAEKDTQIAVAREMMTTARYCALITVDSTGQPHARTMDPFPVDENMVVWLGTNAHSRKVTEIRNDPRVTLYYADPDHGGYVSIMGRADLVTDPEKKKHFWKEEWNAFYADREKDYLLIRVIPSQLDVLSYKHNLVGDRRTWRIPHVSLEE